MKSSDRFAIAIDLGTTTIAASLVDRVSGERLAALSSLNPQRCFGSDLVSRLAAAVRSEADAASLQRLVSEELEKLCAELPAAAGLDSVDVGLVAIAGNPAMEHLLLGLPVRSLAYPPHRPLFAEGKMMSSISLGWSDDLPVYLFPLPGGFVGGDTVAFVHGVPMTMPKLASPRIFLDLGTNGEIAIWDGQRYFATSAAAGPAFEGGNLACGMAALPGAIAGVALEGERLRLTVLGGGAPAGICGSGLLDLLSILLETGVLDRTGRILSRREIDSNLANRVEEIDGVQTFVVYRDAGHLIYLSQEDVRQAQLAKGALRAGMEVLLAKSCIGREGVEEVVLTGSFGAVLTPSALKNVGILPEEMVKITRFVREGALAGVEKALLEQDGIAQVERLGASMKVIPLSGTPAFEKSFLEHINFPG